MKWIYWAFLLAFFAILKIAEEHYFILVFFAPFQDFVWLGFPLFALITLSSGYINRFSRLGEVLVKLFSLIIGIIFIVLSNFKFLPIIVLGTFGTVIFLLIKQKIRLNLSLILMGVTSLLYLYIYSNIYINWFKIPGTPDISILSYNLYTEEKEKRLDIILDLINECDPDVFCIQEIQEDDRKLFTDVLSSVYPYQHYPSDRNTKYQGGIVLSKIPFSYSEEKRIFNRYKKSSMVMNFVRLKVDSLNQLALYNIHLVSNGFGIRNALKKKIKLNQIVEYERNNYIQRFDEARNVLANIDYSDENIIIIGDYNDIFGSKVLKFFDQHFENAWRIGGRSHHSTFGHDLFEYIFNIVGIPKNNSFNFIGIDHAYVSKKIKVVSFSTIDFKYSDHSPILVKIKF